MNVFLIIFVYCIGIFIGMICSITFETFNNKYEKMWTELRKFSKLKNWNELDTKPCVTMFNDKLNELEDRYLLSKNNTSRKRR